VIPVLFVVGAGTGAAMRHLVNQLGFGWIGTLIINAVGAFALGALVAANPSGDVATVVGTGMLGSFTTFSTFALEATEGPPAERLLIMTSMVGLGLAAAAAGYALG
jgi:CrcB protein